MAVSLRDEIDRLADYYAERQACSSSFVLHDGDVLPGVFGLERLGAELGRAAGA